MTFPSKVDPLTKLIVEIRDNPPSFDNLAVGDYAPEVRSAAQYSWVSACNRILLQRSNLKYNEQTLHPHQEADVD